VIKESFSMREKKYPRKLFSISHKDIKEVKQIKMMKSDDDGISETSLLR
jgi:hypothetical protein